MPLAIHHVPLCLTFAYFEKWVRPPSYPTMCFVLIV